MIKGLLFAFAEFAILWLAVWTFRVSHGKPIRWSPFDMREAPSTQAKAPETPPGHAANWRKRAR